MTVQIKNSPNLSPQKLQSSDSQNFKTQSSDSKKFSALLKEKRAPESNNQTAPREESLPKEQIAQKPILNSPTTALLGKKGTVAHLQAQLMKKTPPKDSPKTDLKSGQEQIGNQLQKTETADKLSGDLKKLHLKDQKDLKKLDLKELKTNLDNPAAAAQAAQNIQSPQGVDSTTAVIHVEGKGIPTEMIDKIVDNVRVGFNEVGAPEFQFDLKGDVLGGLKMRISFENGAVKAIFVAENPEVRKFIEGNLQDLQKSLVERGLVLKNLEVRDPEEDRRQRQREQSQRDRREAMEQ